MRVRFDPKVVSYADLVKTAAARECDRPVVTRTDAQQATAAALVGKSAKRNDETIRWVKDDKYYLSRTPFRHLPLTRAQATRINAKVADGARWLSPRQRAMLDLVQKHPKAGWPTLIGVEVREAWTRFAKKREAVLAGSR